MPFNILANRDRIKKTPFLDMSNGKHTVRILGEPVDYFVHYYRNKGSFACLGSDCPVCKTNKQIKFENPKSYSTVPGYNSPSHRHYCNVLDKTVVKVCPSCGYEVVADLAGIYPATCHKCNAFITDVTPAPSNKIKVANINETNATEIMSYNTSILDESKNPIGYNNFDIIFIVTGTEKKNVSALPDPTSVGQVEYNEEDLNNLDNVVIKLTEEEIVALVTTGVSFKDIFAARKAPVQETEVKATMTPEEVAKLEASINDLLA